MIKLATDVAQYGYRPMIREHWNPAISLLITSCWAQNAKLRPRWRDIRVSLSTIMAGNQGLITSAAASKNTATQGLKRGELLLAPGALWRRVETALSNIILGEVIGEGAYSKVHKCTFQDKVAACKIFRNTSEESAFKEIEIMFALRHPNIIGLYAWFQIKGRLNILLKVYLR